VFEAAAAKLNYRQNVFLLLKVFFATMSGIPVYSTPVNVNFKFLKLIRLVFVQFQLDSSFFFKIEAPSKFFFISTHFFRRVVILVRVCFWRDHDVIGKHSIRLNLAGSSSKCFEAIGKVGI